MTPTLLLFLTWLGASISCMGCVVSWLITSKRGDSALKADVNELALLVDRLAKTERRERMSRVRRGEKEPASGEAFPVPPGAEGLGLEAGQVMPFDKNELRRRILMRGKP